jgi:hypothetical protein
MTVKYKPIDTHKILDDREWETYLKCLPEAGRVNLFEQRVKLVVTKDSDLLKEDPAEVIDRAHQVIKKRFLEVLPNGIGYIQVPSVCEEYDEASKLAREMSFSIYFRNLTDKEQFLRGIDKNPITLE